VRLNEKKNFGFFLVHGPFFIVHVGLNNYLPVNRRRREAGQTGSYTWPPDRVHVATLNATEIM